MPFVKYQSFYFCHIHVSQQCHTVLYQIDHTAFRFRQSAPFSQQLDHINCQDAHKEVVA